MRSQLTLVAVLGISASAVAAPPNDAPAAKPCPPPAVQSGPPPRQDPPRPAPPGPNPPRPPEKSVPKISSISPAVALVDNADSITLVLRGSGFENAKGMDITYETDPSQGSRACTSKSFVSDTELTCTIRSTPNHTLGDDLPTDQALHFTVSWIGKDKQPVIGPPSSATFTAHAPLLATELCMASRKDADVQLRLRVVGATANTKVTLTHTDADMGVSSFPCVDVQPLGASDLICYVQQDHLSELAPELAVEIVRVLEYDATLPHVATKPRRTVLRTRLGDARGHVACQPLAP